MNNKSNLRTPTSEEAKEMQKKSAEKRKENNLQVHHKTYLHHGKEVFYLEDLIVLCDNCHHNEHTKNPTLYVKAMPLTVQDRKELRD